MKWKLTLERQIPLAFAFAVVLLILISVASYRSTRGLQEQTQRVMQTLEMLHTLEMLISTMKDAETGQRGYLLTGRVSYLEPYQAAVPTTGSQFERLRSLTAESITQRERLAKTEQLVRARLAKLRDGIELYQSGGLDAAVGILLSDEGKRLMDGIRLTVNEMKAEEQRLLDERRRDSEAATQRTLIIIRLGSLLAVLATVMAYFAIRRELGRRHQAEEKLQSTNRELERSNRELQDFAYVASHDLQEPLRKIQAFGDRLRSKYGGELAAEGRDYLDRIQNAAQRMSVLISDLLTFSRVKTKGQPFTPVDLNQVAREVLGDLEVRVQQSGGSVELDELPTVEADALQMRQLFQNLIGNALKFHGPEKPPVVRVHAEPATNNHCEISVEDNGIGFDEKYLDRIFTPFQRLHPRGEYEGTGMGLAVCRRIVERHGGEITARSAPGQGSKFIITLPINQQGDLE
jgi:signal transduction histidine kinase